jgi:hypothetical protein
MLEKVNCYVKRLGTLLITVALIAGMTGCTSTPPSEVRTWNDLNAVRDNLRDRYILMNDLDSTTAGYTELASSTANQGKGWQPIGTEDDLFTGTFDGQGYEIRDLFINRPGESFIGLFGVVGEGGVVQNIGVVNADVTGYGAVGALMGDNEGTVSNSYSTGSVTGTGWVGGLIGANLGTVSDSYSTGSVTGDERVGGLVGDNPGTVSASFWDTGTSGQTTSDGGTGKTTAGMKDMATFSGAGWNIIGVAAGQTNPAYTWNIVDAQTYPFLSWQL